MERRRIRALVGCAIAASMVLTVVSTPVAGQDGASTGPVPAPVIAPGFFRSAVERGTRSEDGSPGASYWQNWSTYEIAAELNPADGRLEA